MFENLKIRNRLGKAFRIIVTTCSIAAVLGVVMLIVTMTLYKNALNNYGFSQGDIGKALVAFTDTRSATRAIVGYDDDSLISQMSDTHDERKATFEQYWEIVDEVTTTSKEQEIYDPLMPSWKITGLLSRKQLIPAKQPTRVRVQKPRI